MSNPVDPAARSGRVQPQNSRSCHLKPGKCSSHSRLPICLLAAVFPGFMTSSTNHRINVLSSSRDTVSCLTHVPLFYSGLFQQAATVFERMERNAERQRLQARRKTAARLPNARIAFEGGQDQESETRRCRQIGGRHNAKRWPWV